MSGGEPSLPGGESFETMPGWQLDPALPLGEAVFRTLLAALRDGRLQPGDRLREEDIARRLSVSRTPVREAFSRLLTKRFVEQTGGRGLIVRSLDTGEVHELYTMRELLDGAAARLAAQHASEAEIEALWELEAAFEAAGSELERAEANRDFHDAIVRAARNRYLNGSLQELQDALPLLGRTTFSIPNRSETAAAEHRAMIEAIARRDLDMAESTARAHIRSALRARLMVIRTR